MTPFRSGEPTTVVTFRVAIAILRIVWLSWSETKRLPAPSIATAIGRLNRAALPIPSVLPDTPAEPARVETAPVVTTTFRIVLLRRSATKRLPSLSMTKSDGPENPAAVPLPSVPIESVQQGEPSVPQAVQVPPAHRVLGAAHDPALGFRPQHGMPSPPQTTHRRYRHLHPSPRTEHPVPCKYPRRSIRRRCMRCRCNMAARGRRSWFRCHHRCPLAAVLRR
jgi:hypothetical protein